MLQKENETLKKKKECCQEHSNVVVCTVITAVGRLRQEDLKFKAGPGYIASWRPTWATYRDSAPPLPPKKTKRQIVII
jgi:hypothetical protein